MADSGFQVVIRSRPLTSASANILEFVDSSVSLGNKDYMFDHVFSPSKMNEEVYYTVVSEKVQHLFKGHNVSILAYGPTGSGKTYTMGTNYVFRDADKGIIPRAIEDIFRVIKYEMQYTAFKVKISFLELYLGKVYDLLQETHPPLFMREAASGTKVINLLEVPVQSAEEALSLLLQGSNMRHACETSKNLQSSRSHAIFSVHIEQTDLLNFTTKKSKLQLFDLAGSEQISASKTSGIHTEEGIKINLDLLALRHVITSLRKHTHIPYRWSNLTRLLKDSFSGNGYTILFACIDPTPEAIEETKTTLEFACDASTLKTEISVIEELEFAHTEAIKQQQELEKLRELKIELEEKLRKEEKKKAERKRISEPQACQHGGCRSFNFGDECTSDADNMLMQHDCHFHMQMLNLNLQIKNLTENVDKVERKYNKMIKELKLLNEKNRQQEEAQWCMEEEILKLTDMLTTQEEEKLASTNQKQENKELEETVCEEFQNMSLKKELEKAVEEAIKQNIELERLKKEKLELEKLIKEEEFERKKDEEYHETSTVEEKKSSEEENKLDPELKEVSESEEKIEIGVIELKEQENGREELTGLDEQKSKELVELDREKNGEKEVQAKTKKRFMRFFKRLTPSQKDKHKRKVKKEKKAVKDNQIEDEKEQSTNIDGEQEQSMNCDIQKENDDQIMSEEEEILQDNVVNTQTESAEDNITSFTEQLEPGRPIFRNISNLSSEASPKESTASFSKLIRRLSGSRRKRASCTEDVPHQIVDCFVDYQNN